MLIIYLTLAVLSVPLGVGIALTSRAHHSHFSTVFGLTSGAVLGIILMLMLPLYIEYGYATILIMWGGFLLISGLEYLTPRLSGGGGGSSARGSGKRHFWSVHIALIGLSIHSLADGLNLAIAAQEETWGSVLAFAILVHRLPISILIGTALLRDSSWARRLVSLLPFMLAPVVGAFLGERLLYGMFKEFTEYLTAFAVGTLLHIVVDGFRGSYLPDGEVLSNTAKVMLFVGFVLTLCAMYFSGFEPTHAH